MRNITFTKPNYTSFASCGLGSIHTVAAVRNNEEVLCLVGSNKAYQPFGGRKTLKHIIGTTKEGVTYYWKSIKGK